jgi:Uma2 family endonuclease
MYYKRDVVGRFVMTVQIQTEQRSVLMQEVSWDYYSRTLEELGPTRGFRVIFDQGRMEILTTSPKHERIAKTITRLLEMYALESDIPITGLGRLTLRQKKLKVGLEPDDCYYIQTPPPPPIDAEIDLMVFGMPDLAVEVEVSKGIIPKMPMYQALKVAEIWRYSFGGVTPFHRIPSGDYRASKKSLAFPALDVARFNEFVVAGLENQHKALKALQTWLKRSSKRQ